MADADKPNPADALIMAALRGMERATAAVSGAIAELRADKAGAGMTFVQQLVVGAAVTEAADVNLSFIATACKVDNYSDQHLYVHPAQAWAAPGVLGQMFPIAGTHRAKVQVEAPPGRTDPAKTTGQPIVVTWLERYVPVDAVLDSNASSGGPGVAGVSTTTAVAAAAADAVIMAANPARRGMTIANFRGTGAGLDLFLRFRVAATVAVFEVHIPPDGYYEVPAPVDRGDLHGIWSGAQAAGEAANITEIV